MKDEHAERMRNIINIHPPSLVYIDKGWTDDSFDFIGETYEGRISYERLYYDSEKQIAVFRKTTTKGNKFVGYEVVTRKGEGLKGNFGYWYTGPEEHCKEMIKRDHDITL